jgi:hypothetical protein
MRQSRRACVRAQAPRQRAALRRSGRSGLTPGQQAEAHWTGPAAPWQQLEGGADRRRQATQQGGRARRATCSELRSNTVAPTPASKPARTFDAVRGRTAPSSHSRTAATSTVPRPRTRARSGAAASHGDAATTLRAQLEHVCGQPHHDAASTSLEAYKCTLQVCKTEDTCGQPHHDAAYAAQCRIAAQGLHMFLLAAPRRRKLVQAHTELCHSAPTACTLPTARGT